MVGGARPEVPEPEEVTQLTRISLGRKARQKSLERANLDAFAFWAHASKSGPVLRKKDGTRDEFLFVPRARGRCALESAEI